MKKIFSVILMMFAILVTIQRKGIAGYQASNKA